MDAEGYPDEQELEQIKNWDYMDIFGLIDFIESRWAYSRSGYFCKRWGRDRQKIHKDPVLLLELHTAGWSGNESIINELMENKMAIICMGYYQWNTGGHYKFQINPKQLGYKSVFETARQMNRSRQSIHNAKAKYDWITIGKMNKLVRPKILPSNSSVQATSQPS
jgi:hypothetical protein